VTVDRDDVARRLAGPEAPGGLGAARVPYHRAVSGTEAGEHDRPAAEPVSVDVDRRSGVTVVWAGGERAAFDLRQLRVNCPCAECRERRRKGERVWPQATSPQPLRILDARLVGAFGICFDWNDGHGTGIYTWEVLQAWSAG
jgi:DUF971 family protein